MRSGKILESTEAHPGLIAQRARFHSAPGNRLYVVSSVSGNLGSENRLTELDTENGEILRQTRLSFKHSFTNFFTTTPRAVSRSSPFLDMIGTRQGVPMTIGYARVKL